MKKSVLFIMAFVILGTPKSSPASEILALVSELRAEHKIPDHYVEKSGFHPVTEVALVKKYQLWEKNKSQSFTLDGLGLGIVKCARNESKVMRARAVVWIKTENGHHYPSELTLDVNYFINDQSQKGPHVMLELDGLGIKGKYFVSKKHSPADYEWLVKYNPCHNSKRLEANSTMILYKVINLYYK